MKHNIWTNKDNRLELTKVDMPKIEQGQILVKNLAVGINRIDYEFLKNKNFTPGVEGVGIVTESKSNIFNVGQKVCYINTETFGSFAEYVALDYTKAFGITDTDLIDNMVVSSLFKGIFAFCVLRRSFYLRPSMYVVVNGAAGSIGTHIMSLARYLDGNVIGIVGTEEKRNYLLNLGYQNILLRSQNNASEIDQLTNGFGVNVLYDGTGFIDTSIMKNMGMIISYADVAQKLDNIDVNDLKKKSLYLHTPRINNFITDRFEFLYCVQQTLGFIKKSIFNTPEVIEFESLGEFLHSMPRIGNYVAVFKR